MKDNYIRRNILPIALEGLFILGCLLLRTEYHIVVNFLFYLLLAVYFYGRKDFSFRKWMDAIKSGLGFWKQVILTVLFFSLAFIATSVLEGVFPQFNTGMIRLRVDNWFKLILFVSSTTIFPPIVEEIFYRKNLIAFGNKKVLVVTTLLSMLLYALEHTLSIWGILLCMIWALPLSISYIKTKNIYVPMTAHFLCNLMANGFTIVEVWQLLLR
ncbi:CPBP family intramembrane metalloprotease [Aerococcaceae bacterium NML191292]|nr:CPBP family intramembrane metalloprotease [Aerococcaceae bacterium NML191292]MCW6674590.1 CPBP family intramembrane metalloprotease [Aerococcaceae bacterium NML171108]MCW6680441.1 CPBP family intramembrane metalloprotease [Aerococcaceae bacterium NML130460]